MERQRIRVCIRSIPIVVEANGPLRSAIDGQLENIKPVVTTHQVVQLFGLDAQRQIDVRVKQTFVCLLNLTDGCAAGTDGHRNPPRTRIQNAACLFVTAGQLVACFTIQVARSDQVEQFSFKGVGSRADQNRVFQIVVLVYRRIV